MAIGRRLDQRRPASMPELKVVATVGQPRRPRLSLFGVQIDRVSRAGAFSTIAHFLESGEPHQVVTVNLDFLYIAGRDTEFCETINGADLAVADGMPLVWLSHILGEPLPERVTGVELAHESCRLAAEVGASVFFLGGAPGVAEVAAARARILYPGLKVKAYAPAIGPIASEENERIVHLIRQARPGFLFVALGAPRQDLWIRTHLERLGVPVAMGVGCVLDLLAGSVGRAPAWMQSAGFEWTYRLMQEPRRLWRRYLLDDLPLFGRLSLMALDEQRALRRAGNGNAHGGRGS